MKKALILVACLPLLAACGNAATSASIFVCETDKTASLSEFSDGELYLSSELCTEPSHPIRYINILMGISHQPNINRRVDFSRDQVAQIIAGLDGLQKVQSSWKSKAGGNSKRSARFMVNGVMFVVAEALFTHEDIVLGKGTTHKETHDGLALNLGGEMLSLRAEKIPQIKKVFVELAQDAAKLPPLPR